MSQQQHYDDVFRRAERNPNHVAWKIGWRMKLSCHASSCSKTTAAKRYSFNAMSDDHLIDVSHSTETMMNRLWQHQHHGMRWCHPKTVSFWPVPPELVDPVVEEHVALLDAVLFPTSSSSSASAVGGGEQDPDGTFKKHRLRRLLEESYRLEFDFRSSRAFLRQGLPKEGGEGIYWIRGARRSTMWDIKDSTSGKPLGHTFGSGLNRWEEVHDVLDNFVHISVAPKFESHIASWEYGYEDKRDEKVFIELTRVFINLSKHFLEAAFSGELAQMQALLAEWLQCVEQNNAIVREQQQQQTTGDDDKNVSRRERELRKLRSKLKVRDLKEEKGRFLIQGNKKGLTALHLAAKRHHPAVVEWLLGQLGECGLLEEMEPTATSNQTSWVDAVCYAKGATPLMLAIHALRVAETSSWPPLRKHSKKNKKNLTPSPLLTNGMRVILLLLQHGADPCLVSWKDETWEQNDFSENLAGLQLSALGVAVNKLLSGDLSITPSLLVRNRFNLEDDDACKVHEQVDMQTIESILQAQGVLELLIAFALNNPVFAKRRQAAPQFLSQYPNKTQEMHPQPHNTTAPPSLIFCQPPLRVNRHRKNHRISLPWRNTDRRDLHQYDQLPLLGPKSADRDPIVNDSRLCSMWHLLVRRAALTPNELVRAADARHLKVHTSALFSSSDVVASLRPAHSGNAAVHHVVTAGVPFFDYFLSLPGCGKEVFHQAIMDVSTTSVANTATVILTDDDHYQIHGNDTWWCGFPPDASGTTGTTRGPAPAAAIVGEQPFHARCGCEHKMYRVVEALQRPGPLSDFIL